MHKKSIEAAAHLENVGDEDPDEDEDGPGQMAGDDEHHHQQHYGIGHNNLMEKSSCQRRLGAIAMKCENNGGSRRNGGLLDEFSEDEKAQKVAAAGRIMAATAVAGAGNLFPHIWA